MQVFEASSGSISPSPWEVPEEQTGRVTRCSESLLLKLHVNRRWNVYHSTTCFSPAMQSMGKRGSEQIELKPIGSMLTRWIQRATSLSEAPVECE